MAGEEDDFAKFAQEDEAIKPIDASKADSIAARLKPKDDMPADGNPDDPIKAQQAREQKAEDTRKAEIRKADQSSPNNMAENAPPDRNFNLIAKGETIDLLGRVPSLRALGVAVGWQSKVMDAPPPDLDFSIFLLNKNEQTRVDGDFIFYNNMSGCDGAVKHHGEERIGANEGDKQSAFIDLNSLPFDILKVMFVISIYDEMEEGFHLGVARNMYLRLVNKEYNEEICRFVLADEYENTTAIYVAALVRDGPKWLFQTIGEGVKQRGGLAIPASSYGILVHELQSTG